ncbi:MAG: aminodeoxychorismate/anthranilate synthase component II [Desulfobacteraceae bacterium]|jgi:anthranilate synthase/aminodeoxychorismate synthase-like glutamine amidotransferase
MILMIDNYDSFTYNLVQYIEEIGTPVKVVRNDVMTVDELAALKPGAIVISPGPGGPADAGVSLEVVTHFAGKLPILGVCLGHQTIAQAYGGKIISARQLMHGKTSMVENDGKGVFNGVKKPFQAMRYHSLAVERESLPDCLTVTAESEDGEIMGLRHATHQVEGIQFHPESIMTTIGKRLLRNFTKMMDNV